MQVIINGNAEQITNHTIFDYLAAQGIDHSSAIVEINRVIIKKDHWQNTFFSDGDCVEILTLMGGG